MAAFDGQGSGGSFYGVSLSLWPPVCIVYPRPAPASSPLPAVSVSDHFLSVPLACYHRVRSRVALAVACLCPRYLASLSGNTARLLSLHISATQCRRLPDGMACRLSGSRRTAGSTAATADAGTCSRITSSSRNGKAASYSFPSRRATPGPHPPVPTRAAAPLTDCFFMTCTIFVEKAESFSSSERSHRNPTTGAIERTSGQPSLHAVCSQTVSFSMTRYDRIRAGHGTLRKPGGVCCVP